MRSSTAEISAVSKMAVPTADTRSSLSTASYALGCATIGAALITSWSSAGTWNFSTHPASGPLPANSALNGGRLHTVTMAVRMPNGAHARTVCATV